MRRPLPPSECGATWSGHRLVGCFSGAASDHIYVICSGILSVLPHRGAVPEDVGATVAVAVVAENSWHVRVH